MKHQHHKGGPAPTQGEHLVPMVHLTPDEGDLLLEVIMWLTQVSNDPRAGAIMPLLNGIGSATEKTLQKILLMKDHRAKTVLFETVDAFVLYTVTMLFGQIKLLVPVLLPPQMAAPGLAQRVQTLGAKLISFLPPREQRR